MTPYRPVPSHLLPHERKPLPWWRRLVLGWKARRWHRAMVQKAEERKAAEAWGRLGYTTHIESLQRVIAQASVTIAQFADAWNRHRRG